MTRPRPARRSASLLLAASASLAATGGIALETRAGQDPQARPQVPAATTAEPNKPVDLPAVTDRIPYDPELSKKTAAFWDAQSKRDAQGFIELRELAAAYLALGRETGRIEDAVRAEDAARRSLKVMSRGNAAASLRLAQALLAQHRFPEALAVARSIAADPRSARLMIDIQLEIGDYDAALKALETIPTDPEDLNLRALRARFEALSGHPDRAHDLMVEAARVTDTRPDIPAETVAWYHAMIGHALIDGGKLEDGERSCRRALAVFPLDYRAMTGMAEAATWRGDHAAALDWSLKALRVSGQNPEALKLAGDAYAGLGKPREAAEQYRALETLAGSFPRIYDRHWLLFLADTGRDLDRALALARQDLELRHDIHGHDALAWACFKKGLLDEADREMGLALARGTQEAPLFHHASAIAQARGEAARAAAYRARAEALNPYLVKAADEAARAEHQAGAR